MIKPGVISIIVHLIRLRRANPKNTCVIVCSPSHLITPFARLIFRGKVFLDAGWPLSDSNSPLDSRCKKLKNKLTDYLAFKTADFVILETQAQVERHEKSKIWVNEKFFCIYSGFNESNMNIDNQTSIIEIDSLPKESKLIFFRGKYNSESGLELIANSIKYCKENTYLLVVTNTPEIFTHPRIIWINRFISTGELQRIYQLADLCVGQMGFSPRLEFTLAHKIFEAAYHGKSILVQDTRAVNEFFDSSGYDFIINAPTPQKIAAELENCLVDNLRLNSNNQKIRRIYLQKSQQTILGKKFDQLVLQNL